VRRSRSRRHKSRDPKRGKCDAYVDGAGDKQRRPITEFFKQVKSRDEDAENGAQSVHPIDERKLTTARVGLSLGGASGCGEGPPHQECWDRENDRRKGKPKNRRRQIPQRLLPADS
jgi:hypothetical protein